MFWTNTFIFKVVSSFLQSVWVEPTGKIFLVTVIAYSISYIIYSGYIGWFSGGIGSIPLSQAGFSAIDFFGLIPTVYLLLFQLAWKLLKFAFRMVLIYVVAPLALFIIAWLIVVNYEIAIFSKSFSLASFISFLGTLFWMAGFLFGVSSYVNKGKIPKWSWIISCLGALLAGLSSSYINPGVSVASTTSSGTIETNLFFEIGAFFVLLLLFSFPYFMGVYLAQLSVNEKVLSRIQKITFSSPLEISGMVREMPKKSVKVKTSDPQIFTYHTVENHLVYLVATFSKNTAIFLPKETTGEERGKLVVISNSEIRLMEITSGIVESTY